MNWVHNGPNFMSTTHPLRNLFLSSWIHLSSSMSCTMTSTTRMLSLDLSLRRALNTWPPSPRRLLSTATNDFNIDIFLHSPDSPLQKLLPLISRFGFNPRYLQSLPWVSVDQCSLTHDLLTAFSSLSRRTHTHSLHQLHLSIKISHCIYMTLVTV